jgi:hypothetical protein
VPPFFQDSVWIGGHGANAPLFTLRISGQGSRQDAVCEKAHHHGGKKPGRKTLKKVSGPGSVAGLHGHTQGGGRALLLWKP